MLADLRGQRNVLKRGQVLNQIVELKNKTDLVASVGRQRAGIVFGNLLAIEKDFPLRERIHAAENIQQCGLARAGWTDDDADLAFFDLERGIAQGFDGDFAHMIDFFDMFKFNKRFHECSVFLPAWYMIRPLYMISQYFNRINLCFHAENMMKKLIISRNITAKVR